MNRAQFLEEVELYAAHALSPEEMRACDEFLREDADEECRAALRRAQRTWAAIGASIEPVKPDERIWQRIANALGGSADAPARRSAAKWRERAAWAVAVCALLAVALLEGRRQAAVDRAVHAEGVVAATAASAAATAAADGRALHEERQAREACAQALAGAQGDAAAKALALSILQAPDAKVLPLAPQAGATERATALLDLAGHRAALLASSMPADAVHDYELWIIRGSEKIPAGLVKPDSGGAAVLALDRSLLSGKIDAVAVTLEPAGGSPQPRGPILLVAAVKS